MGGAGEGQQDCRWIEDNQGLNPVPPQRWHFTFLSPFLIKTFAFAVLALLFLLAAVLLHVALCVDSLSV